MPRNSLPRGAVPPGHNGLKSMTYAKSAPLQEFTNMDERMTNKLLSVQQQAVNLGKISILGVEKHPSFVLGFSRLFKNRNSTMKFIEIVK